MTVESSNNDAITLSRMNFSGYVWACVNAKYCQLFNSRARVKVWIRFNFLLVSGLAHVLIVICIVNVTLPALTMPLRLVQTL